MNYDGRGEGMIEKTITEEHTGTQLTVRKFKDGHISLFVLPYGQEHWIPVSLLEKSKDFIDFINQQVKGKKEIAELKGSKDDWKLSDELIDHNESETIAAFKRFELEDVKTFIQKVKEDIDNRRRWNSKSEETMLLISDELYNELCNLIDKRAGDL